MKVKVTVLAALIGLLVSPAAQASEPFHETNLTKISLQVNTRGEALVTYRQTDGLVRHVVVWGAINAIPPDQSTPQVRFKFDHSGGWGKYRNGRYWRTFRSCPRYDGPALPYFVAACKASDGSYWALQNWQRDQPLLGFDPWLPSQSAYELSVSHWSGPLPVLEVSTNWSYGGTAVSLFGRLTYLGKPVYGFGTGKLGAPTDRNGRVVYIDTFNSAYGPGWRRESGIVTHKGTGTFCHSFVPQKPFAGYPSQDVRPAAPGERYRVTVEGPGVTPAVQWEGAGLGAYDAIADQEKNRMFDDLMAGDRLCAPER